MKDEDLARVHDIAVGSRGFEDEREAMARGGVAEERGAAVRAGFLVGREEDFPAERGRGSPRGGRRDRDQWQASGDDSRLRAAWRRVAD